MSKAKIIDKKSIDSILGEKEILSSIHHSFIVNLIYSFQDHDNLYLVMDLLPGGNLRYHLSIRRHFNEEQTKFLITSILIGLEYIHSQNILFRDLKPENLVFDSKGYLLITDFGIAKRYQINNKKDTSGTVGYLAPEVLCNVNHGFSIDYYSIGIITYELIFGHRPYLGKSKHEIKQLILTRQAHVDYDELPDGFQEDVCDFINRLIQRKPKNRLGKNGIKEVIQHSWFNGYDWNAMKKKIKIAPYVPKNGDNFDRRYCMGNDKIGTDTIERYANIMNDCEYNLIFKDFDMKKIPKEFFDWKNANDANNNIINNNNNYNTSNLSTSNISRNKNENKKIFNNNNNKFKNNLINNNNDINKSINDKNNNIQNNSNNLGNKSFNEIKSYNNSKEKEKKNNNFLNNTGGFIKNNSVLNGYSNINNNNNNSINLYKVIFNNSNKQTNNKNKFFSHLDNSINNENNNNNDYSNNVKNNSSYSGTFYNQANNILNNNKMNKNVIYNNNNNNYSTYVMGLSTYKKKRINNNINNNNNLNRKLLSCRSAQSLKHVKANNNSYSNDFLYNNKNKIKMNIIDKKLPIINISLNRKKSVFGNEFFINNNNNKNYFKYDYYNNPKINERSYSNSQKKLKNYFEDGYNNNNYKSMYLTKRNPSTKGSLSYFK